MLFVILIVAFAFPFVSFAYYLPSAEASSKLYGDFNGDGKDDLVVGVPGEDIGAVTDAGLINVIYGSSSGLSSKGNQAWSQNSPEILDASEPNDFFGDAIAAGDFNGDGKDDLAIGAPGENIGGITDTGAVNVIYGSPSGLASANNQLWTQDGPNVPGAIVQGDNLGSSLAVGDFNNDGKDDLAIGVPGKDVGPVANAGEVLILYGSASGLTAIGSQEWNQDSTNILDSAEGPFGSAGGDQFGYSLATGDFNNNGFTDLVVGVPGEDVGLNKDAGAVNVLYGSSAGITATGNQFWNQDSTDIVGIASPSDRFGKVLAAGDFNKDGLDDIAIGVPDNTETIADTGGVVHVLFSSSAGTSAVGNLMFNQIGASTGSGGDPFARFGSALSAGDFNKDGIGDLAIGIPLSSLHDENQSDGVFKNGTGSVRVLYGNASSPFLSFTESQLWTQDSPDVAGTAEGINGTPFGCPSQGDCFGIALGAGDFNGDGKTDLAIGAPGEDIALGGFTSRALDQGMVNVIYGCTNNPSAGLCSTGNQSWSQDSQGIEDSSEVDDFFGVQVHGGEHNSDSEDFTAFVN